MKANWNNCENCGAKADPILSVKRPICRVCSQAKAAGRWEIATWITGVLMLISSFLLIGDVPLAVFFTAPLFLVCAVGCLLSRSRKLELMLTKLEQTLKEKEKPND